MRGTGGLGCGNCAWHLAGRQAVVGSTGGPGGGTCGWHLVGWSAVVGGTDGLGCGNCAWHLAGRWVALMAWGVATARGTWQGGGWH